jgi:hypothetical protein
MTAPSLSSRRLREDARSDPTRHNCRSVCTDLVREVSTNLKYRINLRASVTPTRPARI